MADNKRHWDNKRGRGWQRILEGPDKGHWEYYDNWAPTGKVDRSGAKDALPNLVKGAQNTLSWLAENKNKEQIAQSREGKKQIQTGRGSRWVDDPNAETQQPVPTVNKQEISQLDLVAQTDQRAQDTAQRNTWMPQDNPLVAMQGDQLTYLGQEKAMLRQKFITEDTILNNSIKELKQVNTATNNTYVTDYQTAMKQGVPQFYGEDTLAEGPYSEKRMKKSNVFTEAAFNWNQYKEGDTLGVMGRSQREAYDRAFHEWEMKQQVENNQSTEPKTENNEKDTSTEIKTENNEKDTSTEIKTEPNVGSEIKNTGEGGEVFTPPTPLSEEYKSLFSPSRA